MYRKTPTKLWINHNLNPNSTPCPVGPDLIWSGAKTLALQVKNPVSSSPGYPGPWLWKPWDRIRLDCEKKRKNKWSLRVSETCCNSAKWILLLNSRPRHPVGIFLITIGIDYHVIDRWWKITLYHSLRYQATFSTVIDEWVLWLPPPTGMHVQRSSYYRGDSRVGCSIKLLAPLIFH